MIPIRVRMAGWMRYRDEQVADFEGGTLISICGENGAGKSSIFDAILFALYGRHRLGTQNYAQLITQDVDRLRVEFEFEADGQRYKIRRSRGHKSGEVEQGLWIWDANTSDWAQVPGTEKEDALKRSIEHIVRLTPEAFTSSFMLQQGAATEFLDADPKPRFEIISSLIGLKEYEALETAARNEQRTAKTLLTDVATKLASFGDVDDTTHARLRDELDVATLRASDAATALQTARAQLADAERYTKLAAEVNTLEGRIAATTLLIADRDAIERDADLFAKLTVTIAAAQRVEASLADASRSAAASEAASQRSAAIDVAALEAARKASLALSETATKQLKSAGADHDAAAKTERAAHEFASIAGAILASRERVAQHDSEIARMDVEVVTLPTLQQQIGVLRATRDALPALRVLKETREQLEKLERECAADDPDALTRQRQSLHDTAGAIAAEITEAERALDAARTKRAACDALATQLTRVLAERQAAATEATCSRCGQPVDKRSAQAEIDELTARIRGAQQEKQAAALAETAASAACDDARDRQKRTDAQLTTLERTIVIADGRRAQRDQAASAAAARLADFIAHAPSALAHAASGAADARAVASIIGAHGDVPKQAKLAEERLAALTAIGGQRVGAIGERERTATALAADEAKLDGRLRDVEQAAAEHAAAESRLAAASSALEEARAAAEQTQTAEAAACDAHTSGRDERASLDAEAKQHTNDAEGHRRTAGAFASALGDAAEAALADAAGTLRTLLDSRTALAEAPARKLALDRAVEDHRNATAQRDAKAQAIADIPEPHRVDAVAAAATVATAERDAASARDDLEIATRALATFEARLGVLQELRADKLRHETRLRLLKKLVKLLGKNGLQGVLVTDALATITNHANAFLQRLTGGSLQLSIQRGTADALELQAVDSTCMREPRSVRVLSGSQKFRCAVAIASGIGQYAGAGSMRSIVIDEGFGSLDQAGQQQMVDELKQLATHMDKVIVVSHLEAFTNPDNFPDRILVETSGTGSRITRIR